MGSSDSNLLIGMTLTGLMGFFIQRGGTCTVAAIKQILQHRQFARLNALIETSIWSLGGFLIIWSLKMIEPGLWSWSITFGTVLGAILLGLGGVVNGACIVGTISRLGNLELSFIFSLLGYFFGVWLLHFLHLDWILPRHATQSSLYDVGAITFYLIIGLFLLRLFSLRSKLLGFEMATIMIGFFSVILQIFYPSWSFTDVLSDLAKQKMHTDLVERFILFLALLIGACIGGRIKKNTLEPYTLHAKNIIKRFVGGALIGVGTQMIPGGNDSLILFYTPLLQSFALVAILIMGLTITVGILKLKPIGS
jgi:toxin CptA